MPWSSGSHPAMMMLADAPWRPRQAQAWERLDSMNGLLFFPDQRARSGKVGFRLRPSVCLLRARLVLTRDSRRAIDRKV